jgi:hypothetical protein
MHTHHHALGLWVTPLPIRHAPRTAVGMGQAGASQEMQIGGQSGRAGHGPTPGWKQAFILTTTADSRLLRMKKLFHRPHEAQTLTPNYTKNIFLVKVYFYVNKAQSERFILQNSYEKAKILIIKNQNKSMTRFAFLLFKPWARP